MAEPREAYRWLYKTARWQRLRAAHLAEQPLCQMCFARGIVRAASHVDHVEPHRGDPVKFFADKLQSLCPPCHGGAKQAQEHSGELRGAGIDGTPLNPQHPWNRDDG